MTYLKYVLTNNKRPTLILNLKLFSFCVGVTFEVACKSTVCLSVFNFKKIARPRYHKVQMVEENKSDDICLLLAKFFPLAIMRTKYCLTFFLNEQESDPYLKAKLLLFKVRLPQTPSTLMHMSV